MNAFLQNLKAFVVRLSIGQKVSISAVLLGGIAVLVFVGQWASQTEYALLFGSLEPTDADKVVQALQEGGTPYELKEGGSAVYVPRDEVYELRLRFAGQGIVSDGPMGYELFDQGTLGMTDFMQKLNLKRALEGELARTISSIRQVEVSRVHLVMPERSPFRDAQAQPSASVVLQLAGSSRLTEAQIEGIGVLVAGAVEGLAPPDVTVLDTRGNLLSRNDAANPDAAASSRQLRAQRAIEAHLAKQGQSMLDRVLGSGNAIVRISATLDFSRAATERDLIDPESATVISEERLDETGDAQNANSSVRNFEMSRTRERVEKSVGDVSYLTVSVILNQKQGPALEETPEGEPLPYARDEIEDIEALVKNAVGFKPERGDRFAIHQTRFDTTVEQQVAGEIQEQRQQEQLQVYLRYGLMLLAILLAGWLVYSASRRLTAQVAVERTSEQKQLGAAEGTSGSSLTGGEGGEMKELTEGGASMRADDLYSSKLSAEAQARLEAKNLAFEEMRKRASEDPESAAKLIRSWLTDDLGRPDPTRLHPQRDLLIAAD